jgi:hypothetical protein
MAPGSGGPVREQGYFGTSDFRYLLPETIADLIILADADTALIKPFGCELESMLSEEPCIAGHMAHVPPSVNLAKRSCSQRAICVRERGLLERNRQGECSTTAR